ncbi:MAG TPA: hypothetical protein VHS78_17485 [Candidatus Elarobacter sp.]|jgi:hypothetical protein|nr:hypothetical protein [Candidatus Elarobacter sp.]
MNTDEPENALGRTEHLGLFRVAKDELAEVAHEGEEIVRDALGAPPQGGPAIEGEH